MPLSQVGWEAGRRQDRIEEHFRMCRTVSPQHSRKWKGFREERGLTLLVDVGCIKALDQESEN